ncbi:MAG: ATP-dependent protease, partial [Deltaproteobacteria bacterium]|nr:ATP-dependent protease [Deltaproteobacteria bacterium]
KQKGKIRLLSYADFCPYDVDVEEFKAARTNFSLEEWVDIILSAVDYNPKGYRSATEKLTAIKRLLPFVEKRLNMLELAPGGTGKSYLFGQISRFGWIISGNVSRAKLIYDKSRKTDGAISTHDFVALDEIREANYMRDKEVQSALQSVMENGSYRADDGHEVNVDGGIVFLGNIKSDVMNEHVNMLQELPLPFHQPQFLDRIHGFIKGWELPRINEDMKAAGWALNTEYFASIMHELREDPVYRSIVDALICVPNKADTRDTEAVKRLCTAYLKLLFPHAASVHDIKPEDFSRYCLIPAMEMRSIIRMQICMADNSVKNRSIPDFRVNVFDALPAAK